MKHLIFIVMFFILSVTASAQEFMPIASARQAAMEMEVIYSDDELEVTRIAYSPTGYMPYTKLQSYLLGAMLLLKAGDLITTFHALDIGMVESNWLVPDSRQNKIALLNSMSVFIPIMIGNKWSGTRVPLFTWTSIAGAVGVGLNVTNQINKRDYTIYF